MGYTEDRQTEIITSIANNTKSICEQLERIANALETSTNLAISQDYWRRVEQQEVD